MRYDLNITQIKCLTTKTPINRSAQAETVIATPSTTRMASISIPAEAMAWTSTTALVKTALRLSKIGVMTETSTTALTATAASGFHAKGFA